MGVNISRKREILVLAFILFSFPLIITINNYFIKIELQDNQNKKLENIQIKDTRLKTQGSVIDYYNKQWLENPTFDMPIDPWFNTITGDNSDVKASSSSGQADFEILGETGSYSIIANPPSDSNWTETNNPDFPTKPQKCEITTRGCRVSHEFRDNTSVQNPCVHWDQNISLSTNMSDYIIKSVSIKAIVNATVDENLDRYDDLYTNRARADYSGKVDTYDFGDFVRFYVLISDLPKNKVYEIAYYQTEQIGTGNPPGKDFLSDTYMISIPKEDIIYYLSSVLSNDYSNFTISLGIRIHVEDNLIEYYDIDTFDELMIKYLNFTFTYEKKIDQSTSISWIQIGDKIIGNNIDILDATLNFRYKITQEWTELSPNSEIRILINNIPYRESIKLSSANLFFQKAKKDGFNITSLILDNVNISVSIQVFLADEFQLDRKILISIDDVFLDIFYKVTTQEDITSYDLFLNSEDKTSGSSIKIVTGESLNITFKYFSDHIYISNATVFLTGISNDIIVLNENFTENTDKEEYNIILEGSTIVNCFKKGDNFLTIRASKRYFETQSHTITLIIKEKEHPFLLIILLVSFAMIGVLSALSVRTYVFVPRKRKKKSDLLFRTQKFKDIRNIQAVLITNKESGLPLFIKSYSILKEKNKTLFSGFIQAITLMSERITEKKIHPTKTSIKPTKADDQKIVELDFRYFHSLICDQKDLRLVLILNEKASERLKTQTNLLISELNTILSEKILNWDGELGPIQQKVSPLLNKFLELFYKNPFEVNKNIKSLNAFKVKNFSRMEKRVINVIQSVSKQINSFNLEAIIELIDEENEDPIIDAIQSLIDQKFFVPTSTFKDN